MQVVGLADGVEDAVCGGARGGEEGEGAGGWDGEAEGGGAEDHFLEGFELGKVVVLAVGDVAVVGQLEFGGSR